MSFVAMWNCQPRMSIDPASPAKAPHTAMTRM